MILRVSLRARLTPSPPVIRLIPMNTAHHL